MKLNIIVVVMTILLPTLSWGHGKEKHHSQNKLAPQVPIEETTPSLETKKNSTLDQEIDSQSVQMLESLRASKLAEMQESVPDEFPHLHPLIVHFPIVLLPTALFVYGFGFFRKQWEVSFVGVCLSVAGWSGALLSSTLLHPHTIDLSAIAYAVLEQHDWYAYLTVYVSGIATIFGVISLKFYQKQRLQIVALGLLLVSTISVGVAGHYGATLVHIHGVGVQGKYLETDH